MISAPNTVGYVIALAAHAEAGIEEMFIVLEDVGGRDTEQESCKLVSLYQRCQGTQTVPSLPSNMLI